MDLGKLLDLHAYDKFGAEEYERTLSARFEEDLPHLDQVSHCPCLVFSIHMYTSYISLFPEVSGQSRKVPVYSFSSRLHYPLLHLFLTSDLTYSSFCLTEGLPLNPPAPIFHQIEYVLRMSLYVEFTSKILMFSS